MKDFISGTYINQKKHKSFSPNAINRQWQFDNMEILDLLNQANRELGRLDMYSEYIPNIDLFIRMHVLKEATQSNKIEGTKTNIEDALLNKEDVSEEKRDDWDEVQNYILALNEAIEGLTKLPFSSRLIKKTHKTILQGVRGKHKLPGEFRTSQNWIGGATINDAIFIPPFHTEINKLMGDLENFVHTQEHYFPHLLKIALLHYQFETIHPFLDGNGRVGRLMITLYLVDKGVLKKPILYLSDFFEKNKSLYYDNLTLVREKNDLTQWFKFFLVGVIETAKNSIQTFDNILKLQKEIDLELQTLKSRANNAHMVVNDLFQHPMTDAQRVKKITKLSTPSVYKLLDELVKLDIIEEITGGKRGRLYLFKKYTNLFN